MFEKFKSSSQAPESEVHIAAERTNLPLDDFMTRLMAQEIPFLDSTSRSVVYRILREYDGPTITSQEELPAEIRELMDL
ncbi:hypothetical protein SFC07_05165 [Corynebacterium callunae]|uniref:hypothetical protein n=1 Tax=Corynebacterium callunae TaxID=1721 RepID=UPI0039821F20